MIDYKLIEIRNFCITNSSPDIILKYSKYFKDGFDGYGMEQKTFENQRDILIKEWENEMTHDKYFDLGDKFMQSGKFEEKSFAIVFIQSQRDHYSNNTFERVGKCFEYGVTN